MNLLFVYGNGLDINLGLKTGYQDFYDYYLNEVPSSSPLIEKMNKHLSKERYNNWSDLGLEIGRIGCGYLPEKGRCFFRMA